MSWGAGGIEGSYMLQLINTPTLQGICRCFDYLYCQLDHKIQLHVYYKVRVFKLSLSTEGIIVFTPLYSNPVNNSTNQEEMHRGVEDTGMPLQCMCMNENQSLQSKCLVIQLLQQCITTKLVQLLGSYREYEKCYNYQYIRLSPFTQKAHCILCRL